VNHLQKRDIENVIIGSEAEAQQVPQIQSGPLIYLTNASNVCFKLPISYRTKAIFCVNVCWTYFYVKSKATPFDDLFLKEDRLVVFSMLMVFANVFDMLLFARDLELADSHNEQGLSGLKRNVMLLFGFLFITLSVMTPFIGGTVAQFMVYNNLCHGFAVELEGMNGESEFMFNRKVIGRFTMMHSYDNDIVLQIGFKANNDVFQKLNPTGLSDLNFSIDKNGVGLISGDCYGQLLCFTGKIHFPSSGAINADISNNEKTETVYTYPTDWYDHAFRIADRRDHSTDSQTIAKPFRKDVFKTCSNSFDDAVLAVTIAKFRVNGQQCFECNEECRYRNSNSRCQNCKPSDCKSECSVSCLGVDVGNDGR
jgi:hypothetical protein